jgi:hypothetical protein
MRKLLLCLLTTLCVFHWISFATAKPLTGTYIQRYLQLSSELETRLDKLTRESLRACGQKISSKEKLLLSPDDLKQQRAALLDELPEKIASLRKRTKKLRQLQTSRGLETAHRWVVLYAQRSDEKIDELRRGLYRGQIDEAKLQSIDNARKFAAANAERAMSRYLDAQPVMKLKRKN